MQATARITYRKTKSRRTKDNLCPAKLCITYDGDRRYYSIDKRIKNKGWLFMSDKDIISMKKPLGKYKDIHVEYKRIVTEAETIIDGIKKFSFNLFEEKYSDKVLDWDNIFTAMWDHIQTLKAEERFSYASSFESTLRAIKEFHTGKTFNYNVRENKVESRKKDYTTGKPLLFRDITGAWLKRFETAMRKAEKSRSTIGIFTRNIRVLFNTALKVHHIEAEYPFNTYKPKSASRRKTALSAYQISLIANFKTEHPREQFYRDIFMFSFFGCGMNLTDVARLKYSNIINDEIAFVREKTKNEETEEDTLHVPITKTMQAIINTYGNKAVGFDPYLFPILKTEWNEERNYAEIKQLTKQVNKYIKRIALILGINETVSSMVARHSWATITKNSGKATEYISEQLGHSDVKVTGRYLKGFEKTARKENSDEMEKSINNSKAI